MTSEYRRAWAEIDLGVLNGNYKKIRAVLPQSAKLMAIVKADAYGHGAVPIAKSLLESGACAFGVATCEEALELRDSQINAPILVMGYAPEPLLPQMIMRDIIVTVFSLKTARVISNIAGGMGYKPTVYIKIDTGMGRLGFLPCNESIDKICGIASLPSIKIAGIYTHCATSDSLDNSFMYEQRDKFMWVVDRLRERGLSIPLVHMANSGAFAQTLRDEANNIFMMDMARIGVLLYGLNPSGEMTEIVKPLGLRPVMRFLTQVAMVKKLPVGAGVSYSHMFKTSRESLIATLPIGYADGYPRLLSNRSRVLVKGMPAPLIGAICMDQLMVDVTEIPGVAPGDEAVLLGAQGDGLITADELAGIIGTIGYEIVCGIGKRVPRFYNSSLI